MSVGFLWLPIYTQILSKNHREKKDYIHFEIPNCVE